MLLELAWLACYGFIMQIADGFIENSNTLCIEKLYDWRYTIRTICIRIRIVDDVVGVGRLFVKTQRKNWISADADTNMYLRFIYLLTYKTE